MPPENYVRKLDFRLALIITYTTLVPMFDYYDLQLIDNNAYNRFLCYFLIPFVILLIQRRDPRNYGFQIGNWRLGVLVTVGTAIILGAFLFFFARTPEMHDYYIQRSQESVLWTVWLTWVEMWGWEFIWRGWLLFTYIEYFGVGTAILLQAVPFALLHVGKPELETYSTLFGGAAFGWLAWKTRSFFYPCLIHWFIASLTAIVVAGWIN